MSITFGRIGRGMLLVALAAGVLAVAAWFLLPSPADSIAGGSLAILALVMLINGVTWTAVQYRMFGSPAALTRVAASGRRTQAVIDAITPTASSIGANPVMRLDLTIDGRQRRHRVIVPVHHVGGRGPGVVLPVRIDPTDPKPLVVEWDLRP
jgi:hypothetical protein